MAQYTQAVTDRISVSLVAILSQAGVTAVEDSVILSQSQAAKKIARILATEKLRIKQSVVTAGLFHYMLRTAMRLNSGTGTQLSVVLSSLVRFSPSVSAHVLVRIVESLEVAARLGLGSMLTQSLTETLKVHPTISAGWLKRVSDHMRLSPAAVDQMLAYVQELENLTLDTAVGQTLLINVIENETVALDEGLSIEALYRNALQEIVNLGLVVRQPNGTTTTWAVNSRTGAVTEYKDYAYQSIVRLPNGVYLGAGMDGNLYELTGDVDIDQPIVADMVGGIVDFGGSKFTGLKAVYLGANASGKFFLKLTTDNDVTRTYEVTVVPRKTARIDIGKGLRSRYIQWELISTGQNFDIDSIEFVPLISQRRI